MSSGHSIEYRDIEGFPGYRVGTDGSAWSCRESIRGTRLTDQWHRLSPVKRRGYPRLGLWRNSKLHWRSVHRLVLEAFVGPCPSGMECCHRDGDRANNAVSNLRWDTSKGNAADSIALGRLRCGSAARSAKLTEADIPEIKRLSDEGMTQRAIGRRFGVHHMTIGSVLHGKTWKHV